MLNAGTRIGPYEILAAIGAGGMGEVYRASDTKLNRDVAIKVLPLEVASDPERRERFTREAHVLASLNHPHIAAIYGLEEAHGIRALVMELVEGLTLAEVIGTAFDAAPPNVSEVGKAVGVGAHGRVRKVGALPIDEALTIAKQIAEALEAAHEHGIIHRDLKPANIKVKDDGTVKVLDFGLARALDPAGGAAGAGAIGDSPTITSPAAMTHQGVILGTAAYMPPEQAKGRAVDKRADIWAFGCVLFEMLTGKRAFDGDDVFDTLTAVVKNEPDWKLLPAETPAPISRLLRRCLVKDNRQRLGDIRDARIEIEDALAGPAEPQLTAATLARGRASRWTIALPWLIAATLAVAVTALAIQITRHRVPAAHQSVTRLDLTLPPGVELYRGNAPVAAISPDGSSIVFAGVLGGVRQLYIRRLDRFEASPLRGTSPNPGGCFFSPDGRAVGFISSDQVLSRVTLADSLVVTVARDADFTAGAAWGADGRITFGRGGVLWQVAAAGGTPQRLTTLDAQKGEVLQRWPAAIRGGQVILFASVTGSGHGATHIEALSVPTGQRRILVESGAFPMYASSGHLIFFRDGALLAAPFDAERLEITGPAVRVLENVSLDTNGAPLAAVSGAGSLVYLAQRTEASRLVWVSRQGLEQPITGASRSYAHPRLSPDGRRIVVADTGNLWIQDTARSTFTRLTSDESTGNNWPVWTPDGKRLVFRTLTGLRWIDADGSGRSQSIPGTSVVDYPASVSPDGDTLAFLRLTADRSSDVYILSLHGEPQPRPLLNTPAYEGGAQFSPDGRWMAYVSTESGQMEVYVRPSPGPDRKWQVSTEGGTSPRWSRNGRELFYRNANQMMAVGVSTSPELRLSQPRLLFEQRYAFGSGTTTPNYDVSLDGQRFVMVKDESGSGGLNVVLNWFEELKQPVPAGR